MPSPDGRRDEAFALWSIRARPVVLFLFWMSILMDIDVLGVPLFLRSGSIDPHSWAAPLFWLFGGIEIILIIAGTISWLIMLYVCIRSPQQGALWKAFWILGLIVGIWFASQVFYILYARNRTVEAAIEIDR